MKVLNFVRPENGLTEDPLYYMNFEKYEDVGRDCYLFMADFYRDLYSGNYDDKEKVALTLEEPNFCIADGDNVLLHEKANTILTLCPYTAELFDNRTFVFFPFSEDWIPPETEKNIDVSYFGSFPHALPWQSYIQNVFTKYNFRFGHYSMGNVPRCSYQDKILMLASSKVAVVHGLCSPNPNDAERYRSFPKGKENKAFSHLDKGLMPQIKSRMFEAAFSKCVILCQKDPWNPIEYLFTPNEDFIYFDDETDLDKKLEHIINHYDEFDYMRENAYNKAISNYTTKHFVKKLFNIMHSFKIQNQSPWIVDLYNKYFLNKNNGFLVEIGVGHTLDGIDNIVDGTLDKIKNISRCGSNTADLLDLGWSGIYIEPVLEYCDEAKISHLNNFDRLKIINIAAGDISNKIQMFLGDSFVPNDHGNRGYAWIGREVEIQPTSKILSDNECPKNIDLMSIDVEGFEDKVIKGIDFNIHTPNMMVIEINIISLDEVSNLLPKEYEFIKSDNLNAVWVNTKK